MTGGLALKKPMPISWAPTVGQSLKRDLEMQKEVGWGWFLYLTHGRRDFADMIKTLEMGDYLGLPGWAQ